MMNSTLIKYLEFEKGLLEALVDLGEKQKQALVKYDMHTLESISIKQAQIQKEIRQVEEQRIHLLSTWLGVKRTDAMKLKLSDLAALHKGEEEATLMVLRKDFKSLLKIIQAQYALNRVLSTRAKNGISEILFFLTNGSNHVCNVQI